MKVNMLARPDHSLNLFRSLNETFVNDQFRVDLYTFYSLRENSLASKLFPKLKKAPSNAKTLDLYTLSSRLLAIAFKKFGLNFRQSEIFLLDKIAPWSEISKCDLLHYWPFYCSERVKRIKIERGIKSVAEFYEAEPSFVNEIYKSAYDKYGITFQKPINLMIDQNNSFHFETNFIVASEFTKKSYSRLFPNVNFHVCNFGPAGYHLTRQPNCNTKIRNKLKILFVGQVCLEKGIDILIESTKDLNVTVDLIGPIRTGQEDIFKKFLNASNNINYLGPKRHSEVLNLLNYYDVFCLPSLADNYSLAVVEALSRGLPVIVTNNCGNSSDISKFKIGLTCSAGSVLSLSEAIHKIQYEFDYFDFCKGLNSFFSESNVLNYPNTVFETYKKIFYE